MKILSVVFSFYNEEKNLNELIERLSVIKKKLNDWDFELIFVNDNSNDNSEKILIEKEFLIVVDNFFFTGRKYID